MLKRYFLLMIFFTFAFMACEKNIDFSLKYSAPVLVVDAQIENGQPPVVVLSKSLDYFGKISAEILASSFVHNAVITINNGSKTHRLKEYSQPLQNGFTLYFYSVDPADPATVFTGEFNKTYNLNITSEGSTYTAKTTIPLLTKYPDSIWTIKPPAIVDTSRRVLMVRTTDPPGLGNYIRYFTKKNSERFLPGLNSVFNDEIIDGTTYSVQVDQGVDRNNTLPSGDENFFTRGDTVSLKISNIDKATFNFWNTWEFSQQSIGNPFSQPGKVLGNISNGALGAFCGYASWVGTVIAR